jgi:hypothetical protein
MMALNQPICLQGCWVVRPDQVGLRTIPQNCQLAPGMASLSLFRQQNKPWGAVIDDSARGVLASDRNAVAWQSVSLI